MSTGGVAGLSFSDEYGEMLVLLREARKRAGLTRGRLVTQGYISKIERGEIRIGLILLQRFAKLYGVELMELLPAK